MRGRARTLLFLAAIVVALPRAASAQVDPDPLIAPVVFHWPQVQTAWPTLEGGSIAAGSVRFWRRQIKLFELAGFTGQLYQVVVGAQQSQHNHLAAMRDRVREQPDGPLPPRIVPFFAAETFPDYSTPKDVRSKEGFEAFYQAIRAFFTMYAEYFPARPGQAGLLDPTLLAKVDGRVFIVMWWVPIENNDLPSNFFDKLSDRLERDFGFRAYWSVHDSLAGGGPDDVNYLFNGAAPLQRGHNKKHPAVDLLAGFWPPNPATYKPGMFVPRSGGATYESAWDQVIASRPRPSIVLIESYNEISEGSHLMPSWPISHYPGDGHWTGPPSDPRCVTQPCHPLSFTDTWGADNPWRYLDLTRQKIREWLVGAPPGGADLVPPHVFILTPKTDEGGGGAIEVKIAAADDKALRDVRVYLDGSLLLTATGTIDRLLKTWTLTNGRHVLYAEATDLAGNTDSDTSVFIVNNAGSRLAAPGLGPDDGRRAETAKGSRRRLTAGSPVSRPTGGGPAATR